MIMEDCLSYARDYIARYPKTTYELHKQLQKKWYSLEEISPVLERFQEIKLLDDQAYARLYLSSEVVRKGKSLTTIIQKLRAKGVSKEDMAIAQEALEVELAEWQHTKLLREIDKLRGKGKDDTTITKTLATRGYGYGAIKKALTDSTDDNT